MRHCPNQVIQKELDYLGIAKYFTHIVTAMDTAKPKPSPEALIDALKLWIWKCAIASSLVTQLMMCVREKLLVQGRLRCSQDCINSDELAKECPDLILPDVTLLPEFVE